MSRTKLWGLLAAAYCITAMSLAAHSEPIEPLYGKVRQEQNALLDTLRDLVNIESGSRDKEGLDKLSQMLSDKLTALGGKVEFYAPNEAETYPLSDRPKEIGRAVIARFSGNGRRRIMLLAHMDTVYNHGTLAKRPFRVEGEIGKGGRAFGPGIADDKGGVAVILHTLALLKQMEHRDYAALTVVINGDEEISSPGSRKLIERIGAEHDYVISFEPSLNKSDAITLATSGIGMAFLNVKGKSAHAGVNPELGRNAIVELAHQILQTRNLSDPSRGIKFNWTLASGGATRNVIPETASAFADVRVQRVTDFDIIEPVFREKVKTQLIADAKVDAGFERRRAPLQPTDAARSVARQAQAIYAELGKKLAVDDSGGGGGTDAAFAAVSGKPATLESFGLMGYGYHSSEEEYVELDSIAPRLYLTSRLITELGKN